MKYGTRLQEILKTCNIHDIPKFYSESIDALCEKINQRKDKK